MADLQPLAACLPQPTNLLKTLQASENRQAFALERARLLFGQFRRGEANDPATFAASVAAVLSRYPDDVIIAATDPRTGLALRSDWLPTVREVGAICEEFMTSIRAAEHRERAMAETLRWRQNTPAQKPTIQELREKYGDNWGLSSSPQSAKPLPDPWEDMKRLAASAGVSMEVVNAFPASRAR